MVCREHGFCKDICGFILILLMSFLISFAVAQQNPAKKPSSTSPPVVKKLGENLAQVGNITVNTQKKELSVQGKVLPLHSSSLPKPMPGEKPTPPPLKTLEYLATSRDGMKAYESALELDTDATTFNFACIMIGLEKSNAVLPKGHFDPTSTKGDLVEIWVEWAGHKIRAEEMLYDETSKSIPQVGAWIYTGSKILSDGRFMAEMDGTIIGFVHDPDTIIESSIGAGLGAYGTIHMNPSFQLAADMSVKLTVRALPRKTEK
jgi:hypothetical protein